MVCARPRSRPTFSVICIFLVIFNYMSLCFNSQLVFLLVICIDCFFLNAHVRRLAIAAQHGRPPSPSSARRPRGAPARRAELFPARVYYIILWYIIPYHSGGSMYRISPARGGWWYRQHFVAWVVLAVLLVFASGIESKTILNVEGGLS